MTDPPIAQENIMLNFKTPLLVTHHSPFYLFTAFQLVYLLKTRSKLSIFNSAMEQQMIRQVL